jgi:hypothetical protein
MPGVSTDSPVDKRTAGFLAAYLIFTAVLTGYVFVSLWSAQPAGQAPAPSCGGIAGPRLTNLYPNQVNVAAPVDVIAIGCNLPNGSVATINGTAHPATFIDSGHIRIPLTSADVAGAGALTLVLSNAGANYATGAITVGAASAAPCPSAACFAQWSFLGFGPFPLTPDVQLLLLVLAAGAFGSAVYALKSMSDYRGDNKLYRSWVSFYIIQPFEGAGIALIMYLVIRGGFLAGASTDAKSVNQFGLCAIAALAGAFSDIAFLKLREVFLTLFKPQDDRGGKGPAPKIGTTSLPDGTAGVAYSQTLQASGGTAPLSWSVSPALPAGLKLDAATGAIAGTPSGPSPKTPYTFTVADKSTPPASATADLTLEIKAGAPGLKITTASLPDGTTGAAYNQTLTATGGSGPLRWSVSPSLPAPLALNPTTGSITGTPATAAPKTSYTFTATDGTATATVTLSLEIH